MPAVSGLLPDVPEGDQEKDAEQQGGQPKPGHRPGNAGEGGEHPNQSANMGIMPCS